MQEIDRQESGRQDPDRAAIGEPAGAIEDGERGGAEQRRDQAPDQVEERRVPAERPGHAAGEGPERQAIHARHHVHVQAGPVEEPRVQVSLVEAHRPLDDPRLVGMVEVRQAVRRAPRPERQTEEQDEEKAETEASLRASRGGRAWKGRRGECERRARVAEGASRAPGWRMVRGIAEPGDVPVSPEVTEPEGPLMRPSAAASGARGPARLPARASLCGQMLADLGTHHEIEALVPEGQRACVPSHERDAGAARARFLRRRLIESSPSSCAPGRRAARGANANALAAADVQYAARGF